MGITIKVEDFLPFKHVITEKVIPSLTAIHFLPVEGALFIVGYNEGLYLRKEIENTWGLDRGYAVSFEPFYRLLQSNKEVSIEFKPQGMDIETKRGKHTLAWLNVKHPKIGRVSGRGYSKDASELWALFSHLALAVPSGELRRYNAGYFYPSEEIAYTGDGFRVCSFETDLFTGSDFALTDKAIGVTKKLLDKYSGTVEINSDTAFELCWENWHFIGTLYQPQAMPKFDGLEPVIETFSLEEMPPLADLRVYGADIVEIGCEPTGVIFQTFGDEGNGQIVIPSPNAEFAPIVGVKWDNLNKVFRHIDGEYEIGWNDFCVNIRTGEAQFWIGVT